MWVGRVRAEAEVAVEEAQGERDVSPRHQVGQELAKLFPVIPLQPGQQGDGLHAEGLRVSAACAEEAGGISAMRTWNVYSGNRLSGIRPNEIFH